MKLAYFTLSLLLCLGLQSRAAEEKKDDAPDFEVEVESSVYPAAEFESKGVRAGNMPAREKRPDALPDKNDREAVFARVPGLGAEVAGLDELDRDLLFVRAKNYTLKELRKLYPRLDAKKLTRLKKEAAK